MATQCACTTNTFNLFSSNFVVGQVYWLVIDGCGGNVCDYTVDVVSGSTVPFPPANPGPITGPVDACVGNTNAYSITPPNGATIYDWTLTPPLGTMSGGNDQSVNVAWGNTGGTADLCVTVGNACELNPTPSCVTIDLHPTPTAAISGNGKVCSEGQINPVTVTINFTGDAPWTFSYNSPNGPVGPITTSDNPYTFTTTTIGNYSLQNVTSIGGCVGTVSGTVAITEVDVNVTGTTTAATCTQSNGAVNITAAGGAVPYTFNWSNGAMTEDLSNVPPGTYTVTATDADGCQGTASFTVADTPNEPTVTATTVNSICGLDNGSIDVSVTGGASPYTYIWGGGQTTQDISNVPAGSYSVTVTGADGCTRELAVTVANTDPPITITGTVVANTTCNGGNGSISTTVAPATPPGGGTYTYNWGNGETTPNIQDLVPGTYVVTVSTGNSCEGTASFTVPDNPDLPEISSTTVSATCSQSNGSINVSVGGGVPPYTFSWGNGETTEDLSNVPPGSYTVTVTGANGCTEVATITVADMPNQPTVTATTVNSQCGQSDGSINVSVSGGSSPYTYIWGGGETTQDINNVPAGTYSVTVTGADGCTSELSVTVANTDPPINITAAIVANTTCSGGNGSISITVAPQPPPGGGTYTYNWDNGETTPNLQNLTPGTYTVTVSTGTSCQGIQSFTVPDQPNEPAITFTTTPSTCSLDNGSINVSVSGGVTPYTFNWGNGETTEDLSNIPQGSYSVTVTGANGCTDEATISLTNNNPAITVTPNITPNQGCGPGNWNGNISITIQPTPSPSGNPYIINWNTGATTTTVSNLEPGNYTVTVNGGGTCETIQTFNVPDQPNPPVINITTIPSQCGLSNGSASISVSGGVQPYTILWSNGSTGTSITNMPAGSYSVTVTGANGCSAVANANITDQPINFNVTSNITPNSACNPSLNNGAITITVLPSNNNYTINWSTGATGTTITGLGNGSYSVTVSAGGSCQQVFTYAVPFSPILPGVNMLPDNPSCGLSNGILFTQGTGQGTPPFTYIWSTGATTPSIANMPAGTYTVTVTGANGCSTVASGTLVDEDIPINLSADVTGSTSCIIPGGGNGTINLTVTTPPGNTPVITWSNGATGTQLSDLDPGTYTVTVNVGGNCEEILPVTIPDISEIPSLTVTPSPATCGLPDGEADLMISGGVPPYSYFWSNGSTNEDLFGVTSGLYTVTVTSSTGCVAETSVNIGENTLIFNVTAAVIQNTSCGFPNGYIDLFVSPPGNYTFLWNNGTTDYFLYDLAEGTYTVTVTAAGNCSQVYSYNVFDLSFPPDATASAVSATCGQSNGGVNLTVVGNSAPYQYQWSNGATTEDLTNVPPGTYTVIITDINQCIATAQATVSNNNVPINISGTTTANTSCSGSNGAVNISINPAGTYTYTWSNGATTEDIANVAAGSYTVTVSSGGTCTSTASFTVANNVQNPSISPTITAAICSEANGEINLTVTGATPPYTFLWSNGSTDEDQTGLLPGAYTVTVSGVNNCSTQQTFNVPNNSSTFSLNGTETPLTSCAVNNGAVDLTVTPSGTYTIEWSNGSTSEDLVNLPAGTYVVTVTESGSCSASATFVIADETSNPAISQSISPELCGQEDGSFDITVTGSTTPYTYLWSNGSTGEDLVDVPSDIYTVTVTGANGCTATVSAEVPENTISFDLQGTPTANTSCDINNGGVNLTVTPQGTYTFLWSNGATTEDISGLAGGSYSVTVSAGGDCTASANFNVPSTTADPVISQTVTPAVCGEMNGGVNLSVSGGQAPYTFLWSNGSTDEDLVNVLPGAYSVQVTGANGCEANANFTIPNNSIVINIAGTPQANNSCANPNGAVNITVIPASTTYTFVWSNGQSTEDLTGLAPGNYSVTVYEGATCQATANFTVGNNTNAPNVSPAITDAICGEANGGINLTAIGGTMPYTFLWSNGATTEDLVAVLPGNYTVTVSGADGCSNTGSYTVGNDLININIQGTPSANTACVGGNGSVVLNITPSGSYTYLWSNAATTQNLADLPAGNYEVTVSAAGNCSSVASFQVADNPALPTIDEVVTASICGQPDGAIDISPVGGVAPFTFLWSNGETTEDLVGILSGTYQVTVTDAVGCTATDSYNVANNSNTFNINGNTAPNTLCGTANGSIDLSIAPAGIYGFEWSNGEMTEDLTGLPAGSYTVTVTDGGTCTASATFTIGNNAPTVNVSGVPVDVRCFGENTGEIALSPSGGVAPYTFVWTPNIPGNPEDPTNLAAGSYSVVVMDASGCTGSASFTINQPASLTQVSCSQTVAVSLPGMTDGAAVVNVMGGTAPYTVSWTPGGSQSNVPSGNFNIDNLGEGAYSVLVVDANGCESPCLFNINTNDCVTAVGTMSNSLLSTCGDGCITATYNGANQYLEPDDVLEYILHTGSINQIVGEIARNSEPTFCFDAVNMTLGTTYYISAVAGNDNGNGNVDLGDDCTQVSFGTPVSFKVEPVAAIETPNQIDCDNAQVPLEGSSSLPGSTFTWSTTNGVVVGNPNSATIMAGDGGDYMLIVMANGCADTAFVTVEQAAATLTASITATPTEVLNCIIDAINLVGSVSGANAANYTWTYNGQTISTNPTITVNQSGTYTLTVVDPTNGCQDIEQIFIDDNTEFPPLSIGPAPTLNCIDTVGTLTGSSSINGVQFFWATINGTDTTIIGNGPLVDINAPGTYYLIGVATNNCTNVISVNVDGDYNLPSANAGPDQSLDCVQTPIELLGSSNASNVDFNWTVNNPNVIISNPNAPGITVDQPGIYTLTVTQLDNNCQATDQIVIDLYENVPQADIDISGPDCFGDENGSIFVDTDPANGPYTYSLDGVSNGSNNFFAPLPAGNYELLVTDGQGCTWSTFVFLPEPEPVIVELGADVIVELGESVTLQVLYSVPTDQLDTILWTPSELFPCPVMPCDVMEITPFQQTSIQVTVVDTNGCEDSDILALFVRKDRNIYIPNAFSPNGDGTNDVFMIFSDNDVLKIKSFLVFSRWGETVFEYYDFVPNNPAYGWDGTHREEPLNPAVFAWFAEVEFVDGQTVLFEGDVSLIR